CNSGLEVARGGERGLDSDVRVRFHIRSLDLINFFFRLRGINRERDLLIAGRARGNSCSVASSLRRLRARYQDECRGCSGCGDKGGTEERTRHESSCGDGNITNNRPIVPYRKVVQVHKWLTTA